MKALEGQEDGGLGRSCTMGMRCERELWVDFLEWIFGPARRDTTLSFQDNENKDKGRTAHRPPANASKDKQQTSAIRTMTMRHAATPADCPSALRQRQDTTISSVAAGRKTDHETDCTDHGVSSYRQQPEEADRRNGYQVFVLRLGKNTKIQGRKTNTCLQSVFWKQAAL